MNVCVVAGRLIGPVTSKGTDRKILRFGVETRDGQDDSESKERVNLVPCVLFNPSADLETLLSQEGVRVEFQGRVSSWSNGNGDRRGSAEVVVFNRSLNVVRA